MTFLRTGLRALAASAAALVTGVLATTGPAMAASVAFVELEPTWTDTMHQKTVWVCSDDGCLYPQLGKVLLTGMLNDTKQNIKITVCDSDSSSVVALRVYPKSGGYIDYPDDVADDCFRRDLGYPISHFRVFARSTLSNPVSTPAT